RDAEAESRQRIVARMFRRGALVILLLILAVAGRPPGSSAADKADAANDFFETTIRPLLVEHCHKCHGETKPKSGLRLTSRTAILRGGDTGPAAVPGKPNESLLIQAVRQQGDLKMPPKEKLTQAQIDQLTRWVQLGLPWPETNPEKSVAAVQQGNDYLITDEQRQFWSFQPV